jgi:spore coat polysaccharide biosynthesis predicted glycosyltransferase SpsG/putative NADH-flavin reductase
MNNFPQYFSQLREVSLKKNKQLAFSLEFPYSEDKKSYLLPFRESRKYVLGACKIFKKSELYNITKLLDGNVDLIFFDAEVKNEEFRDVENQIQSQIKETNILPIKVNDLTALSADNLLSQLLLPLNDKKIVIVGLGNIGSKLALKLSERGVSVLTTGRDLAKVKDKTDSLNKIKISGSNKIKSFDILEIEEFENADAIVGFSKSYSKTITKEMILKSKEEAIILDGGIGNIRDFSNFGKRKLIRLDIRSNFAGYIDTITETNEFIKNSIGRKEMDGKSFVSGGLIGKKGEIILDSIKNPSKVIGKADGAGGLMRDSLNKELLEEKMRKKLFCPTFIFRVDGGSSDTKRPRNEQGMGNIARSLILARHLRKQDYNVFFIMKDLPGTKEVEKNGFEVFKIKESEEEKEIIQVLKNQQNVFLIIDKLDVSKDYISKLKQECKKIITVDNNGSGALASDLNLYPLYNVPKKFKGQNKFHEGPNLVLLREEFQRFPKKEINSEVKKITVSLGGTDPTKTTLKVIKSLKNKPYKVTIIAGPAFDFIEEINAEIKDLKNFKVLKNPKNFEELLFNSDLSVVSGGITPYESAFLGVPCITIPHNSGEADHSLEKFNFVENLGMTEKVSEKEISSKIESLATNKEKREQMSKAGKLIFKEEPINLITRLLLNL